MDPITTDNGTVSPERTLLEILRQSGELQNAPLISDHPGARIGAAFQGFHAGTMGQPNPAVQMALRERAVRLEALNRQAGIAAQIAALENTRATQAETLRHHRATEAKADEDIAAKRRDFGLKYFTDLSKHADGAVRLAGFKGAQEVGLLPRDLDVVAASQMSGPDFESKHDQVLSIVSSGGNPFDRELYGERYPVNVFGPVVMQAQRAMQQPGGAMALNDQRFKKDSPETVMKARYAVLGARGDDTLTANERRERDTIKDVLKLHPDEQTQIERLATTLAQEDVKEAKPRKNRSAYMEQAASMLSDKQSMHRAIEAEADRKNLTGADRYDFIRNETAYLNAQRAAATQDATRLPERERAAVTVIDQGSEVIRRLTEEFTKEERAKYAGYFNYKGRQLAQIIARDLKFARFRALVNMGKTMAFSDGGKNLTQYEGGITFGWVPTGEELSAVDFEEKLGLARERLDFTRQRIIHNAITPQETFKREQKAPAPAKPVTPSGTPFRFKKMPDGRVVVEEG